MKVGFIGCGNMGSALARVSAKYPDAQVYLYDKDSSRADSLANDIGGISGSNDRVAGECDMLFLAVKPNILPIVSEELKGKINPRATLVSMAAGVTLARLSELFPDMPIIRIMPNTPSEVGSGMILWCKNELTHEDMAKGFVSLMEGGATTLMLEESKIDAGTAVSGCGPAFVFMFIDALIKGGVEAGLSYEVARILAAKTVEGAAKLLYVKDEKTPEELRIAVCSPGGSTIEGVKSLMNDEFEKIVARAVASSFRRTQELGK